MDRRISKLAVAALILALVGFFACTSIAAIVLGVIAWLRIRKSKGRLGGAWVTTVAIAWPVLLAYVLYLPYAIEESRPLPSSSLCGYRLAQVGEAMLIYANAHNGRLPPPSIWCDTLLREGHIKPEMLHCAGVRNAPNVSFFPLEWYLYVHWKHARSIKGIGSCDFAMNPYLEEKGTSAEPDMILLFETRPGWNQVGGPEALTTDHHNGEGCNVVFLDSHVSFVKTADLGKLRWKP